MIYLLKPKTRYEYPSKAFLNMPPTAFDDNFLVDQDTTSEVIDVLANDTDPEGGSLSVVNIAGTPVSPGVADNISVTDGMVNWSASEEITFTPDPGYTGPVSFSYTMEDMRGAEASAVVYGTVQVVGPTVDEFDLFVGDFSGGTLVNAVPGGVAPTTDMESPSPFAVAVVDGSRCCLANPDDSTAYNNNLHWLILEDLATPSSMSGASTFEFWAKDMGRKDTGEDTHPMAMWFDPSQSSTNQLRFESRLYNSDDMSHRHITTLDFTANNANIPTVGVWKHFAFVHDVAESNYSAYANGNRIFTAARNPFNNNQLDAKMFGGNFSTNCYVTDIRISSIARYTGASYTPPDRNQLGT